MTLSLLLAKLCKNPGRGVLFYLVAGILASLTALLAFGAFLVAIPLVLAAFWIITKGKGEAKSKYVVIKTSAMLAAAALPIGVWMLRNRSILGNWSGSKSKQEYLTWTLKPVSEIFHHPLFSWDGFWYFVSTLSRNFWRGEMFWHDAPRIAWIDPLYLWLSIIFCSVFMVYVIRAKVDDRTEAFGNFVSISLGLCSILFLVALSLPFDFGRCFYPSRAHPYFVSGRLIIGGLLPFLIAFLGGLQIICAWISRRFNPLYVAIGLSQY